LIFSVRTPPILRRESLPPLPAALTDRQSRREVLADVVSQEHAFDVTDISRADLARRVHAGLETWRSKLTGNVAEARPVLREILVGPITLTPNGRVYEFNGRRGTGPCSGGAVTICT
jgi:hypothetical protein